jgi:uncharacterized membrane protein
MPSNMQPPRTGLSQRRARSKAPDGSGEARAPRMRAALPPPLELRTEAERETVENVPQERPLSASAPVARAVTMPVWAPEPVPVVTSPARAQRAERTMSNPRLRALICYVAPFVPALVLLARERRNSFVRLHAARALAFYAAIVVAQVALFVALVLIGGLAADGFGAVAFGLLFYGLFGLLGVAAVGIWLRLLADAAAGTLTPVPLLTAVAWRIEWAFARMQGLPS